MKRKLILAFALAMMTCLCFCLVACDEGTTHEHTFSSDWTFDTDNHWHVSTCDDAAFVSDLAAHKWDKGSVLSVPTATSAGQTKYICTVCAKEKTVEIAPVESITVGVHYDLNGGAWIDEEDTIPDYNVLYINTNSIILTENEPVLENCVFGGWDVQVNSTEKTASIKAIWLAGMENVFDENGDPINPKRLTLDENGNPDFIPTKSATYIDINENGIQDEDEPEETYTFTGWAKSGRNGTIITIPVFKKQSILLSVKFDFNGGYPSDNLYNMQNPSQTSGNPSYYYQIKKVVATNGGNNPNVYRSVVMDNDTKDCLADANPLDTCAWNGKDQISIPFRVGYTFIGWSTTRSDGPTNDVVLETMQNGAQISGHTIYYNNTNFSTAQKFSYYAVWKEDSTNSTINMKQRVAFDFNGGYPSMILGGTITANLDPTATIWETNTTPVLNHYVQYKAITGSSTGNTTFGFTVSDDSTQNSVVDGISIPVRSGYYFMGWALTHDTGVVMGAPSDSLDYSFDSSTNIYTFDGSNLTQTGTYATFYAVWRQVSSTKLIVQFIEDDIDFSTGDGTYHSDEVYTPQCYPALSINPNGGIFLETIYNTLPILAPNPSPQGGMFNSICYEFDHWTYDPVNNPDLDAFDTNTTVDIPYVLTTSNTVALRFYAVYREANKCVYSETRDVSNTVHIDKFTIEPEMGGEYMVLLFVPESHPQEVTTGVKIEVIDAVTEETTTYTFVPPTRLEYHDFYFDADDGDIISISYVNNPSLGDPALGGLAGGLLSVQIFYLG